MGGRKDDALTRTPRSQRKRPLSIIEEHDFDDADFRNDNNNNNDASKKLISENNKSAIFGTSNLDVSSNFQDNNLLCHRKVTSDADVTVFQVTSLNGTKEIITQGSPQGSRKLNSSRSAGRRQALIPNSSPKLGRSNAAGLFTVIPNSSPKLGRSSTAELPTLIPNSSPKLGRSSHGGLSTLIESSSKVADDDARLSDLTRLKQTAERLRLSTRRPSVMQWRAQFMECPEFPVMKNPGNGDNTLSDEANDRWTPERKQRIDLALDWLRNELAEMRTQDQMLARQLLTIKNDIHQLKLTRSCEAHQDMLDDVQSELEELQEFAYVLDLPQRSVTDSPLKHLGVTRMNISARRFSTC